MRARLEQPERLPRDFEARLVEDVIAQAALKDLDALALDRLELVAQVRQHEGEQRRLRQLAAMQADREATVADRGVRIGKGLAGRDLGESQPLVERERCD